MESRALLWASRDGYVNRDVLEVTPRGVRLLVPASRFRWKARGIGSMVALAYAAAAGAALALAGPSGPTGEIDALTAGAYGLAALGLGIVLVLWDRMTPSLLAEAPESAMPLEILGVKDWGTFQAIRARARGVELWIDVHGRPRRIRDALRLAGIDVPA